MLSAISLFSSSFLQVWIRTLSFGVPLENLINTPKISAILHLYLSELHKGYEGKAKLSRFIPELTNRLAFSFGLRTDEIVYGLPKMDLVGTALQQVCPPNPIEECRPGRFRTYSGHCNNVNHPLWGAAFEPMARYLAPDYSDGIDVEIMMASSLEFPNLYTLQKWIALEAHQMELNCQTPEMWASQFLKMSKLSRKNVLLWWCNGLSSSTRI